MELKGPHTKAPRPLNQIRFALPVALLALLASCDDSNLSEPPMTPKLRRARCSSTHALLDGSKLTVADNALPFVVNQSFVTYSTVGGLYRLKLTGRFWSSETNAYSKIQMEWIKGLRIDISPAPDPGSCVGNPTYEVDFLDVSNDGYVEVQPSGPRYEIRRKGQPLKLVFDCQNRIIDTVQTRGWLYFLDPQAAPAFDESVIVDQTTPNSVEVDLIPEAGNGC